MHLKKKKNMQINVPAVVETNIHLVIVLTLHSFIFKHLSALNHSISYTCFLAKQLTIMSNNGIHQIHVLILHR